MHRRERHGPLRPLALPRLVVQRHRQAVRRLPDDAERVHLHGAVRECRVGDGPARVSGDLARRQPDARLPRARLPARRPDRPPQQHEAGVNALRRLGSERAMALPLAMLVLTVTGVMVVGVIEFSSASGRTANIARSGISAEALRRGRARERVRGAEQQRQQPDDHDPARLRRIGDELHAGRLDLQRRHGDVVRLARQLGRHLPLANHLGRPGHEHDRPRPRSGRR